MSTKQLDRREFLVSAASGAVVAGVAAGASDAEAAGGGGKRYDLIVVGGGNAGMAAAIFAAARGARVLIIEAAGQLGGTLHLSSGQMSAGGIKLQKSKGIEDSGQLHFDDVMRISKGTADKDIVRLATLNAADTFDWLMDHGLDVYPDHPILGTTHEPYSRPRYAWDKGGGMKILEILMAQLQPLIDSGQVKVLTSTRVVELVQRAGDRAVIGVVTQDESGKRARHAGHNVALTCGGYSDNPEMYAKYEKAPDYCRSTWPYSQGAGITLGLAAGGWVRGGQNHTPLFGAVLADDELPSTIRAMVRHFPPNRPPYEIYVNAAGQRFLCEDVPSHDAYEQALSRTPGETCWVVFDDAIIKAAKPIAGSSLAVRWTHDDTLAAFAAGDVPNFYKADTLEALARKAGIDAAGLEKTVAAYNRAQSSGQDPLGRKFMPLPIAQGPFYGIRLRGWNLYTYAGLAVDGRLNVVGYDGKPIPGLYAAGEMLGIGQLMGKAVCGGMSVTPALALGRVLGGEILEFGA